jgi:hypothetical protein
VPGARQVLKTRSMPRRYSMQARARPMVTESRHFDTLSAGTILGTTFQPWRG